MADQQRLLMFSSRNPASVESIANIREAIAVYLQSLQAHGEPLPVEDILIKPLDASKVRQARFPRVPSAQVKLELGIVSRRSGQKA